MNSFFLEPVDTAGVSVTHPDTIARPKPLIAQSFFVGRLSAEFSDFRMSWLPTYTDTTPKHVPARPARIGVTNIFISGIAPTGWLPTYPNFRHIARLHRTFSKFGFDPLSGAGLVVAQRMAWYPRVRPIFLRPKVARTQFAYTPPPQTAAGSLSCTAMADRDLTSPAIITQAMTVPALLAESLTVPAIINEGVC